MGWGDELMAAGEAEALPVDKVAIFSGHHQRWHEAWENNPKIARIGEAFDAKVESGPGHRPYFKSVTNEKWEWLPYKPKPAKLYFSREELDFAAEVEYKFGAGMVVVEPNLKEKQESVNRDWGFNNYHKTVLLIDANWVQLGPRGTKVIPGVKHIITESPRQMAAVLHKSKAFLSPEGGLHHTAAALGVRGCVIFGGFISPLVTGYDLHYNFYSGNGCGVRVKCKHCEEAMMNITPDDVAKSMSNILF